MAEAQSALLQTLVSPQESECFAVETAPHIPATVRVVPRVEVKRVGQRGPDDHADDHGRDARGAGETEVGEESSNLPDGGPDEGLRLQRRSEMTEESEACASEGVRWLASRPKITLEFPTLESIILRIATAS